MKKYLIIFLSVNVMLAILTIGCSWAFWYCPIHEGNTDTILWWWWDTHRVWMPFVNAGLLIAFIIYKLDKYFTKCPTK